MGATAARAGAGAGAVPQGRMSRAYRHAWADRSLRAKGLLVAAVPLVALGATLAGTWGLHRRVAHTEAAVSRQIDTRTATRDLLVALLDAETGVRGYLAGSRRRFLAPYREARRAIPSKLRHLERRLATDAAGRATYASIEARAGKQLQILDVLARRRLSTARERALLRRGKRVMDALRGRLFAVWADADRRLDAIQATGRRSRFDAAALVAAGAGVGLVGGLASMLLFVGSLVRRVRDLTADARRLADAEPLAPRAPGRDEVGDLGDMLLRTSDLLRERDQALARARTFLERLIGTSPVLIVHELPAGRGAAYVSPNVERLLGHTPATLGARPDLLDMLVHADDRAAREEARAGARAAGDRSAAYDCRVLHADGSTRWMQVVEWLDDEAGGTLAFLADVTERRAVTDELHRSNTDLERFAYAASHDLQEPLRTAAGYLQLLARRCRGRLDPETDEYIGFALAAIARMQHLIGDLLAYARLRRGPSTRRAVECDDVVGRAIANLDAAVRESEARITTGSLPSVVGDPTMLVLLFQNLIGNAIKFRASRPPEIAIDAARRGDRWQLAVRDNGIGIQAQYHERIFALCQRLHSRETHPGSGIGLALCQRIVEGHGGRLWVESEPGRGSTFLFTLPAADSAARPHPDERDPGPLPAGA
jgi:PAS domain S-box-containing protein